MDPLTFRDPELRIGGIPVQVSNFVVEGEVIKIDERKLRVPNSEMVVSGGSLAIVVGPLTYWSLAHQGRWPFESAWNTGMAEVRRERRRAMKS